MQPGSLSLYLIGPYNHFFTILLSFRHLNLSFVNTLSALSEYSYVYFITTCPLSESQGSPSKMIPLANSVKLFSRPEGAAEISR